MKKIALICAAVCLLSSCIVLEQPISSSQNPTTSTIAKNNSSNTSSANNTTESEILLEAYDFLSVLTDKNPLMFDYEFDYSSEWPKLIITDYAGSESARYFFYFDISQKETSEWYDFFVSLANEMNTDNDPITYGVEDDEYVKFDIVRCLDGNYFLLHIGFTSPDLYKHIKFVEKLSLY